MNAMPAIRAALDRAGRCVDIRSTALVSGGCIHTVVRVELEDDSAVAAKVNRASMRQVFEEEAAGLRAIAATETVMTPEPFGIAVVDDAAAFVMEWLEPTGAGDSAWERFGEDLARLHGSEAGSRYGFAADNHLGSTPQPNSWSDDWVRFNAEHRLGHQLALARNAGRLESTETQRVQKIIDRLDELIPRRPHPALLHGDLWSGNAFCVKRPTGPRLAVIDPACSIGDGLADIAMMQLFGGFPRKCFESYRQSVTDGEAVDAQIAVYQLYHVLNHVNIFGRGYAAQAMTLCDSLR